MAWTLACPPFELSGPTFATKAASANRGLMDFATSSAVVPLGTSFTDPSGSLTLIVVTSAVV